MLTVHCTMLRVRVNVQSFTMNHFHKPLEQKEIGAFMRSTYMPTKYKTLIPYHTRK